MAPSDNVKQMRRLYERAWNEGDADVVDEVVDDDFVFNRGGVVHEGGADLYKELIDFSRETFPNMEYSLEDVIGGEDGNKVVIRWEMTGTHEGEYKGIPPTGQTVEMEGIEINRFEDGKLVEMWTHPNWIGFLEDIGTLPFDGSK